ncbi:short-chain dehydrogenase [Nocardioides luteus]|uniref:Short-chain dehydrogenase n=1 Tax=Nocardioides luteus TaxID=1844 RepID=A0ABQ5STS0_9ACTN|nr:short-chain dehydrogenase [Nocardioides luteus]GLJ67558.1 short-chain dehydrogenase [Nocardioides luteus]
MLITGASAGIGAEFARRLASRGSDLVLVARRADRLDALASQLRAAHGVAVTTLPMDLALPGVGQRLRSGLGDAGVEVTAVVNNAGFANSGLFHTEDLADLQKEIALDVSSVVEISHAFLPSLRGQEGGFLANVASMAAYQAGPRMAVYGACKAFVLSFTEALWYEARDTDLRVLALSPGATETEFFDIVGDAADGGSRRMAASDVVRTALSALDRRNPPPSVIAGRSNRLAATLGRLVGRRRSVEVVGGMMTRAHAAA